MSFKCLLGFHDWEQLGFVDNEAQLWENLRAKKENRMRLRVETCFTVPVVNRVCLRCNKIDNSLEKLTKKIKMKLDQEDINIPDRRERAKSIWENR